MINFREGEEVWFKPAFRSGDIGEVIDYSDGRIVVDLGSKTVKATASQLVKC